MSELCLLCSDLLILYVNLTSHLLLSGLLFIVQHLNKSIVFCLERHIAFLVEFDLLLLQVELFLLLCVWHDLGTSSNYQI